MPTGPATIVGSMPDPTTELASRMRRPQRHRLLNGYPIAPLMLETPRPVRFLDAYEHDVSRPLIIGILPHTFCNPARRGCGFCTFPHEHFNASAAHATTTAVGSEVRLALQSVPSLRQRTVPAVYLGGGTANLGRPEDLDTLLAELAQAFDLRAAELTLEGVPRYFTVRDHAMLGVLDRVACRQRRISMGLQTFDPVWLERMGRSAFGDAACVAGLVQEAHRRGCTVSADLLYNLPSTGADHAIRDLDTAITMGFDQICVYNLVLSAGMQSDWAKDKDLIAGMPGNEQACATWLAVREHLLGHGYVQRTLTNFERAEVAGSGRSFTYERLSFDPLHTDGLGFGPGAISTLTFAGGQAIKWTNVATSASYRERMAGAVDSPVGSHFLYEDEDRRQLVLTRGIALGGIEGAAFTTAFGVTPKEAYGDLLAELERAQLMRAVDAVGRHELTPTGMFYADAVVGLLAHRRIAALADAGRELQSFHGHM